MVKKNMMFVVGILAVIVLFFVYDGGSSQIIGDVGACTEVGTYVHNIGERGGEGTWITSLSNGVSYGGTGQQGSVSSCNGVGINGGPTLRVRTIDASTVRICSTVRAGTSYPQWIYKASDDNALSALNTCFVEPNCNPSWQTGSWSSCINDQQSRSVTDNNSCGVNTNKPATTQTCSAPELTCDSNFDGKVDLTELSEGILAWSGN